MTEQTRFDLEPEYRRIGESLASLLINDYGVGAGERSVIAIAGESGSGKTIAAVSLQRGLSAAGIAVTALHQDDYFRRPPRANHEHRKHDLGSVGPQEVDLELLRDHVAAFRASASNVGVPQVDYAGDRFLTSRADFSTDAALVVEGTYVLRLDDIDVRIFLEATSDDTRERRRLRNRDLHEPFVEQVLAIEHDLIAPQAAAAHIVIDRDFHVTRRK